MRREQQGCSGCMGCRCKGCIGGRGTKIAVYEAIQIAMRNQLQMCPEAYPQALGAEAQEQ